MNWLQRRRLRRRCRYTFHHAILTSQRIEIDGTTTEVCVCGVKTIKHPNGLTEMFG